MVGTDSLLGIRRPGVDAGRSVSSHARRLRDRQDGGRLYRSVPEIMDIFLLGHRDSTSAPGFNTSLKRPFPATKSASIHQMGLSCSELAVLLIWPALTATRRTISTQWLHAPPSSPANERWLSAR